LNKPVEETVPQVVDQADATLAVNCCVEFSWRVTAAGVTVTARTGDEIKARSRTGRMRDRVNLNISPL
jgi:hypothetical protein